MRRPGSISWCLLLLLPWTSCGTPYALRLADVDEGGPQRASAIQLSDPQVYSRENLINDRRDEEEYLRDLLVDSRTRSFKPQLERDLRTLEAISASMAMAFDPLGGLTPDAHAQKEKLHEIKMLELEKDLLEARRALQQERMKPLVEAERSSAEASAAMGEVDEPSEQDQASGRDKEPPKGGNDPLEADTTNVRGRIEKLHADLVTLLGTAETEGKKGAVGAKTTDVSVDPEEELDDRQAYRARIRSELASVRLDDLHDYKGNALYRLQFRATVLPGKNKDKWGVARLTVRPPRISQEEIDALYRAWLVHLTMRMNPITSKNDIETDYVYEALAASGKSPVYKILRVPYGSIRSVAASRPDEPEGEPRRSTLELCTLSDVGRKDADGRLDHSGCRFLRFAVPPDERIDGVRKTIEEGHHREILEVLRKKGRITALGFTSKQLSERFVDDFSFVWPFIASAVQSLRRFADEDTGVADAARALAELQALAALGSAQSVVVPTPGEFKNLLCGTIQSPNGTAFAYATSPTQQAQRVSTMASNARSLELALAVSARLPQYGAKGDADAGLLQTVAGNVEALERVPTLVGFSDRTSRRLVPACPIGKTDPPRSPESEEEHGLADIAKADQAELPQFGWVFGPPARIDAEEGALRLEHTVAAHDVSADVSVPGWWPSVEVDLERAWVRNWHHDGDVFRKDEDRLWWTIRNAVAEAFGSPSHSLTPEPFTVRLPLSASDLDGLTDLVAFARIGPVTQRASITRISPHRVPACAKTATIRIYGRNVWQSSRAYLAGNEARSISVLPHMEGIAAEFDLDAVFDGAAGGRRGATHRTDVTVESRFGSDTVQVSLRGSRRGESCTSDWPLVQSDFDDDAAIAVVSPPWIPACATGKVRFYVQGENLWDFVSNPATGALGPYETSISKVSGSDDLEIEVDVPKDLPLASFEGADLELVVPTEFYGLATASVPVRACGKSPAAVQRPTVSQRYVVASRPVRLHLSGPNALFPSTHHRLSLAVRPAAPPAEPWLEGERPIRTPDSVSAEVELDPAKTSWVARQVDGARIAVARVLKPNPTDPETHLEAANQLIFYSSADAASIRVENAKIPDLPADLSLRLPIASGNAFPGLASKDLAVSARIQGHPAISVSAKAPQGFAAGAQRNVALRVDVDAASREAYEKAHKEELQLRLEWKGTPADVPSFDRTVTIEKR